jgi:hypothetical protein
MRRVDAPAVTVGLGAPWGAADVGAATSYLKSYPTAVTAYVVVLRGHFTSRDYPGKSFTTMYFVIGANDHGYVAGGLEPATHALKLPPPCTATSRTCPSLRACGATPSGWVVPSPAARSC